MAIDLGVAIAAAASGAAAKSLTQVALKEFNEKLVTPFFKARKVQATLLEAVKRYVRSAERSTRFIPTIAIQGSQFSLDVVYEPMTIVGDSDKVKYSITKFPSELFNEHKYLLVTDAAGMGKSTLSKYLLRTCIAELKYIPVLIELRRVSRGQSLIEFICDEVLGRANTSGCIEKLIDSFEGGGYLFILDGYDEVDDSQRSRISVEVERLASNYPECRYWLTSRPDGALVALASFSQFKIAPLTRQKAHALLKKYDNGRGKAKDLIEKIGKVPQVNDFLGNPLMVTLLYKAYDYKATIPLKKNIFFRQVFEALYQDHDLSKQGAFERRKKSALDVDDFHKFLRALGVIGMRSGRVQQSQETFHEQLVQAAAIAGFPNLEVGKIKSDLLSAVPVFVKDGTDVRWSHKALQDYFAAQFVVTDAGQNSEAVVSALVNGPNPLAKLNVLQFIAEADSDLVRDACVRPFASALLETFANSDYASEIEFGFANFFHSRLGVQFLVFEESPHIEGFRDFSEISEVRKKARKFAARKVDFRRATWGGIESACVVSLQEQVDAREGVIMELDGETFPPATSSVGALEPTDIERAKKYEREGVVTLNAALGRANDRGDKLAILRIMAAFSLSARVPTESSLRKVLEDDRSRVQRDKLGELLDGLLGGSRG